MRLTGITPLIAMLFAFPAYGQMPPNDTSCEILDLIGQNRSGEVREVIAPKTGTWDPRSQNALIEQLEKLLREPAFDGGAIYNVGKLGDNFEEHLMVLRLAGGEIGGARLLYEWTPSGLSLTKLDLKSDFRELLAQQLLQSPQPIRCD